MKRIAVILGLTLVSLAPKTALGQTSAHVSLLLTSGDSVLALRPGESKILDLQVHTGTYLSCAYYCYYYPYGLSAYTVTLLFNEAQAHVVSATGVPGYAWPDPQMTFNAGAVTLDTTAATSAFYDLPVARVRLGLDPAATVGSWVNIQLDRLTSYYGGSILSGAGTTPLRICHASKVWGDLDSNGSVTTRDALIALSGAVGLPINSFDLSVGDVDSDARITSRDALFMLDVGVGIEAGRTGHGIADACPIPPAAPPAYLSQSAPRGESR